MVVDLITLEKAANHKSCLEALHFEYCFTENGGEGLIISGQVNLLVFSTRELPAVVHNVVKFAAKRLNMSEQTLRRWAELRGLDELPCEALTKKGKPCQNPLENNRISTNPKVFDVSQKFFCGVHR